jgi:glyoxylase-like metal-dependent hydrolase (beta-lactamase superfamily II)
MYIKKLVVGQLQTNCYLVHTDDCSIVVDPGDDSEYITSTLQSLNIPPTHILATHGHFDHILAAFALQTAYKIPFLIHKKDEFLLNRAEDSSEYFTGVRSDPPPIVEDHLEDKEIIHLENEEITVVETPGHTPGSISLISDKYKWIISGDLVFADGYIGRTDFKYSNKKELQSSIKKILSYPLDYRVYPGHGNETTIEELRKIIK